MALLIAIRNSQSRIGVAWFSCTLFSWAGISLPARAELPVAMSNFSSGGGTYSTDAGGVVGTIDQRLEREIFNWASFNVGVGNEVIFRQPGTNSIALNRIFDAAPSEILGKISANGSIYLINRNGILFGDGINGGQISVGGRFLATTLDISDSRFINSNLFQAVNDGEAALFPHLDGGGNALASGGIEIKSGFSIGTAEGGDILIIAPEVINGGSLSSAGGNTVLAASEDRVYLTANTADTDGSNIGGILVEVDTGGSVQNLGSIVAERGAVTLLGLAVNQSGLIRATTTTDNNGAIRLLARDKASIVTSTQITTNGDALGFDGVKELPAYLGRATRTGTVTFGSGSVTEVVPHVHRDASGVPLSEQPKVADAQQQRKSLVEVMGKTISLESGSTVRSTGGEVRVNATENPTTLVVEPGTQSGSRIHIDSGAVVDVSGVENVVLSADRNTVEVELRGIELADSPLQRDSVVRGEKVLVDARKGTKIANIDGYLALTERTVDERLSEGGVVKLHSTGDVVVNSGSTLDVSGGSLAYQSGWYQTTKLLQNGRVVDISDADPDQKIDAILGPITLTDARWGVSKTFGADSIFSRGSYVDAYTEGKAAGRVDISAGTVILNGNINATTVASQYQRDNAAWVPGGTLAIDTRGIAQNVVFSGAIGGTDLALNAVSTYLDDEGVLRPRELVIADSLLNDSGLSRVSVETVGTLTQRADSHIELAAGNNSKLQARAAGIDIAGSIRIAGGTIDLATRSPQLLSSDQANDGGNYALIVRDGAVLDVSGVWTNDNPQLSPDLTAPVIKDGGTIALTARGDLTVESGSTLNADAGAHLDTKLDFSGGDGGKIAFATRRPGGSTLTLEGNHHAYGFGSGGTLAIEANGIHIGSSANTNLPATTYVMTPSAFLGGYGAYDLTANLYDAAIAADTTLNLRQQNFVALGAKTLEAKLIGRIPGGSDVATVASIEMLDDAYRTATDFSLTAIQTALPVQTDINNLPVSTVTMGSGAIIDADPGATIEFSAGQRIVVDGRIEAHGGAVAMNIAADVEDLRDAASRGIWLLDDAVIDVSADFVARPGALGTIDGRLFDAGSITLDAKSGYVVAQTGSVLDVSGGSQRIQRVQHSPLFGTSVETIDYALAAGSIAVRAADGIFVDSTLQTERSSLPHARGASLSYVLDANDYRVSGSDLLMQLTSVSQAVDYDPLTGIAAENRGHALVGVDKLNEAQLDTINLEVRNRLPIDQGELSAGRMQVLDDVNLGARSKLSLSTTNLDLQGHALTLAAQNVQLGLAVDSNTMLQSSDNASIAGQAASGSLTVNASFIDLVGNLAVGGGELLSFLAGTDIRARSLVSEGSTPMTVATLTTDADIVLQARQLYPTTLSDYRFDNRAGGDNASIRVVGVAGERQAPLSVAGKLTFNTGVFSNEGVITAPLGQIAVNASSSATLAAGSITSVTAVGQTLPFGRLLGGDLAWTYPVTSDLAIDELLEKRVDINAPDVDFEAGATIDIRGGGDIYAIEFTPGPGGTKDVLAAENAGGAFAIIPSHTNGVAAYDALEWQGSSIAAGTTITLTGVPGLADGTYTVMPARYALIPGAYLVAPSSSSQLVAPGTSIERYDGSRLVAGKFGVAGTAIADSQWSGFVVAPGTIALTRSQYNIANANTFFDGISLTPQDAGAVSVAAISGLQLAGNIKSGSNNGGLGGRLDISAENLAVVAETGSESGFIELLDSALQGLGVDSLLLGGRRQVGDDGTQIEVAANAVKIGAGASLSGPEVMLAANETVTLAQDSTLTGSGSKTQQSERITTSGDGVLVRVSSANQVDYARSGSTGSGAGDLVIEQGARLGADAAVLIDATGSADFSGSFGLKEGGSLSLNANRIALGGSADVDDVVYLSDATLAALAVDDLRINSRSGIDFYGSVAFDLETLTLSALNMDNRADAAIDVGFNVVQHAVLGGGTGVAAPVSTAVPGSTFSVRAATLQIGQEDATGELAVGGFGELVLAAEKSVLGVGETTLSTAGDLRMETPLLTVDSGAELDVAAEGALAVINTNSGSASELMAFGGQLALMGESVEIASQLRARGGSIELAARSGDIELQDGSLLDVSGLSVSIGETTADVDGGSVTLRTESGRIAMAAGAGIDLSSGSGAGSAGALMLRAANGAVDLRGDIDATASSTADGGRFTLDARELEAGVELFPLLESAGFTGAIDVRLRSGDLQIAADERVTSERIRLRTDSGDLSIGGVLTAIGDKADVLLAAGRNLLLGETAQLRVGASGANQHGELTLQALNGQIEARQGSSIDMTATGNSTENGRLTVWTPRSGNDVAITAFDAALTGVGRVDLVATADYSAAVADGVLDAADAAAMNSDNAAFYTAAENAIATRLADLSAHDNYHLQAGSLYTASGDLTISGPIDLSTYRYGSQAEVGRLVIATDGNLTLAGELSDGLVNGTTTVDLVIRGGNGAVESKIVQSGESWSLGLVAGRDATSSWFGDTVDGVGNVQLNANSRLRTGTGDIDIRAGKDLILADQTAVIYTVGRADYVMSGGTSPAAPLTLQPDTGLLSPFELYVNGLPHRVAYANGGGDIAITVGGDIDAADSNQLFSDWLHRAKGIQNGSDYNTWAVSSGRFQQGVATLGGGNIDVTAGGDINNLSLSTPTTGKQIGSLDGAFDQAYEINGGGDIDVRAGGDIQSLRLLVDRGAATVTAGGDIGANTNGFGALIAVGDGSVNMTAVGDIAIAGVFDPMLVPQSILQNRGTTVSESRKSYFFSYTDESGFSARSLSGDLLFESVSDNAGFQTKFSNLRLTADNATAESAFRITPPSMTLEALQGDVGFSGQAVTMFPSSEGSLRIVAGGDIRNVGNRDFTLRQSDADPQLLANAQNPVQQLRTGDAASIDQIFDKLFKTFSDNPLTHALIPVHQGDADHSQIAAGGMIGKGEGSNDLSMVFELAQQVLISAGLDVSDVTFNIQHNNSADHSRIDVGRDLIYRCSSCDNRGIVVSGPGMLQVSAGRDIDLGASGGIVSIGNRDNLALPDNEGADIRLLAGIEAGPDYAAFAQTYLGDPARFAEQFLHFLLWSAPDDVVFALLQTETGSQAADRDAAIASLRTLPQSTLLRMAKSAYEQSPTAVQQDLVLSVYLEEVQRGGVENLTKDKGYGDVSGYARSYAAIEKLFPAAKQWMGEISLIFSTVQSQRGGNVELIVPGGGIDVGLAGSFAGTTKESGDLGIMAQSFGNVRAAVSGDISVNASRIFALDAGDIMLWSSQGDIDAGRGAKTALTIPPPRRVLDPETGQFRTELPAALSGSGIQAADNALTTTPARFASLVSESDGVAPVFGTDSVAGTAYLFAPQGVIDAGDAGILAVNAFIDGQRIIGADNIDISGVAIGLPVSTNIGASLAGVGDVASSATESATSSMNSAIAETAAALAETGVAFVTIDIIGIGE